MLRVVVEAVCTSCNSIAKLYKIATTSPKNIGCILIWVFGWDPPNLPYFQNSSQISLVSSQNIQGWCHWKLSKNQIPHRNFPPPMYETKGTITIACAFNRTLQWTKKIWKFSAKTNLQEANKIYILWILSRQLIRLQI